MEFLIRSARSSIENPRRGCLPWALVLATASVGLSQWENLSKLTSSFYQPSSESQSTPTAESLPQPTATTASQPVEQQTSQLRTVCSDLVCNVQVLDSNGIDSGDLINAAFAEMADNGTISLTHPNASSVAVTCALELEQSNPTVFSSQRNESDRLYLGIEANETNPITLTLNPDCQEVLATIKTSN